MYEECTEEKIRLMTVTGGSSGELPYGFPRVRRWRVWKAAMSTAYHL